MIQNLQMIISLAKTHGSLFMFFGGLVEQIIIPIPSPVITMSGGAFLLSSNLSLIQNIWEIILKISLPYSLGAIIGTSLIYLLAYYGGRPLVDKFGRYVGISWSLIEKIKLDFQKTINDEVFIFLAVIIPVVPVSLISGFCGAFRLKPLNFYPIMFLALTFRSLLLGFIGFQMGTTFLGLASGLDKIESLLTIIGVVAILGFLFLQRQKWLKKNLK